MSSDRRGAAVVLLLVVALVATVPVLSGRLTSAATLAEAVGGPVARPLADDVRHRELRVGDTPADLYDPGSPSVGLLLVPGAAPAGRDDVRVLRLATALARSGRRVLVPELALYGGRFVESDLDVLVESVETLHELTGRAVTVLGFSLGGSLGLVAAAERRARSLVDTVATFGAYADITGLLQAVATGVSVVDGERYPWEPPPQATAALRQLALELTPPTERVQLAAVLDSGSGAARLPPAARAAYNLVTVSRPDDVPRLVDRLPTRSRALLTRFSPAAVAEDVDAQVLAMHSRDDPAVPYAELLRLRTAFPSARTYTVDSFRHVDFQMDAGLLAVLRDISTAWRFADDVLT